MLGPVVPGLGLGVVPVLVLVQERGSAGGTRKVLTCNLRRWREIQVFPFSKSTWLETLLARRGMSNFDI